MRKVFTTVSDIALCQKCPALLAYKVHKGINSAYRVGIKGSGEAYGSIFHKNIAKVFFEAGSDTRNTLHREVMYAVTGGFRALDDFIRERIFLPFVESESKNLTSGQIISLASGVRVWIHAMSNFFREVSSLIFAPEKIVPRIFMKPEQKLQAEYVFTDLNAEINSLVITGRYDALLFNPDRAEARLFEFKSYNKSDIIIPLSQSLVYSWLIEHTTGITPSIEIIYLDERSRDPEVFDSRTVSSLMKSGLENLFKSVFNVVSLINFPAVNTSKKLCSECRFSRSCKSDIASGFRKRNGISLLSVIIFTAFAFMVISQVFFYSVSSNESVIEEREIMRVRLILEDMIRQAKTHTASAPNKGEIKYNEFRERFYALPNIPSSVKGVDIHNLDYKFDDSGEFNKSTWMKLKPYERIFAQMKDMYLIRAYAGIEKSSTRSLMIQAVVNPSGEIKTWQEVWYSDE